MKSLLSQTEVPWAWALKQGLGDPYRLHQWIWKALPHDPDAPRDFLFRSDVQRGILRVLLLSERVPAPGGDAAWKTTELSPTFLSHPAYRFQLRANPTFCRHADHKRLALFAEDDIRTWFVRKFDAAGCEVRDLETTAPRKVRFRKGGGTRPGTLYGVDASGVLAVRDETAFRAAFDAGIGSAKGFGFGLLMLQPVQM